MAYFIQTIRYLIILQYGKAANNANIGNVLIYDLSKLGAFVQKRIDPNWIYEDQQTCPIGGASINVPSAELLLVLKIIGCISRNREISMADDKSYFESKIWKDCHDIANLANHVRLDNEKISRYFKQVNIDKALIQEFLNICDMRQDALDAGESKMEPLNKLLDLFK